MTSTGDPTWYEELLQREQDANAKLVSLCEKQQELIKHLENVVENLGAKKPLGKPVSSSSGDDDGHVSLGPDSPRMYWTGTTSDLIPVKVHGNNYRALILTSGMIKQWNNVLGQTRRLVKYTRERRVYLKSANWLAGRSYHVKETPDGRMVDGEPEQKMIDKYNFDCDRAADMLTKRDECYNKLTYSREHLEHKIRLIFKRYSILESDESWLQDLRNSRDKETREIASLRDSTSLETPDCDSMGDDF